MRMVMVDMRRMGETQLEKPYLLIKGGKRCHPGDQGKRGKLCHLALHGRICYCVRGYLCYLER